MAIQGALSLLDVTMRDDNEIWESLSSETREILPPYIDSKLVYYIYLQLEQLMGG